MQYIPFVCDIYWGLVDKHCLGYVKVNWSTRTKILKLFLLRFNTKIKIYKESISIIYFLFLKKVYDAKQRKTHQFF